MLLLYRSLYAQAMLLLYMSLCAEGRCDEAPVNIKQISRRPSGAILYTGQCP